MFSSITQILLFFIISFIYIYILGIILLKYSKKNEVPENLYKGNLILAGTTAAALVIMFYLIEDFDNTLIGIIILVSLSFIYTNIDLPIVFPKIKENCNKQEILIRQTLLSVAFVILFALLYFSFVTVIAFI